MFDANARGIQKGIWFFAKVADLSPESRLVAMGIKKDDMLLCKMRDSGHKNPRVKILTPCGGSKTVRSWDDGYEHQFITYEGLPSGGGFISLDSWFEARGMLKDPSGFKLSKYLQRLVNSNPNTRTRYAKFCKSLDLEAKTA